MSKILTPDICVIGAGSGGLTVAAAAAMFGVSVVLIERGRMGGDCLNVGCVPSKSLIAAAARAHQMRNASQFGISDVEPEIDFEAVNAHVRSVIEAIAPNDSVARFTALGVHVITDEAAFVDRRTVKAGDVLVRARRFVIATGSSPAVPDIPGLTDVPYLTNETVFELKRRPAHLAVIGGGAAGIELAQAFRRLGSRVTVIERGQILSREDPEAVRVVRDRLVSEGVELLEQSEVAQVMRHGKTGIRIETVSGGVARTVDATYLLVAAGRRPNVAALDLARARVSVGEAGIKVGPTLRTTNRRVYAIGDVTGGPQFTHAANHHAGLVLRSILFRLPARTGRAALPRVTFTSPELAHVGMSEAEALAKVRGAQILRWPYAENDRAQAERATGGFIKLVIDRRGTLLGATIVGAGAGEMINLYSLALTKRLGVRDLAAFVSPYPTMTEIGKRAAISYLAPAARKPSVRRLVRFLRIFG
ncbi:MAG: FAD-dependent oxidoreductase [Mesorhizobium sp.]